MGPFKGQNQNSQRDIRQMQEDEAAKNAAAKDSCCTAATEFRPDPRQIIEQKIEHHTRCADRLHRLLRALPQEMHRDAEMALVSILWHEPI